MRSCFPVMTDDKRMPVFIYVMVCSLIQDMKCILHSALFFPIGLRDSLKNYCIYLQVIRVVLLWVNNHFRDFEIDPHMSDFLVNFMCLLDHEVI